MTDTGDILDELRVAADELLASVGRDGSPAPHLLAQFEALALAAHQAGHPAEEITVAARLSYHYVCTLVGIAPPEPERTPDGRQMWRLNPG